MMSYYFHIKSLEGVLEVKQETSDGSGGRRERFIFILCRHFSLIDGSKADVTVGMSDGRIHPSLAQSTLSSASNE